MTKTGSHRRRGRRTGCRAARAESIRRARRTTMRDRRRPRHHVPDHHRRNAHESVGARQAEYPGGGGMGRPVAQLPDRANNPGESSPGPRRARTIALADGRSLAHIHTRTQTHRHRHTQIHRHTHTHTYTPAHVIIRTRVRTRFFLFCRSFLFHIYCRCSAAASLFQPLGRARSLSRSLVRSSSPSLAHHRPQSARRARRTLHHV